MSEQDTFERLQLRKEVDKHGSIRWFNHANQLHRDTGPAVTHVNGYQAWYINDKLHRTDGPAAIFADGTKVWYINDKLHRTDGPAAIFFDGTTEWYLNGRQLTEEQWHERTRNI